ncbi:phospholipid phosphatase-related protein type 1-like isoform X2 [Lineus longissimus]|uniref:phospholipid phosphatase-related protein type 1-like isoform X2 n=1 Tax=Lineus longissimus TaxID=88925 RepID=UPI002B4E6D5C
MMSYGPYSSRRDSFERIELTDRPKADHWISPETPSEHKVDRLPRFQRKPPPCLVVFSVLTDFLLLSGTILLEYFLRWTNVFPYRKQRFSCGYDAIKQSSNESQPTFESFFINGKVSVEVVWIFSFCLPPAVMLFFEIIVWSLNHHKTKEFRVGCGRVDVPQIARRLLRFTVVFIFGAFVTLVIVDVSKMMVGRLRPIFLEVCNPKDLTRCSSHGDIWTDQICRETDLLKLKYARTSFPSMQTAITAYAAIFLSVYLHGVSRTHSKNITVPFFSLGLILCSLLCGYSRIGHNQSFWEDVLAGFIIGLVIALYLGAYVLRSFDYHEYVSNRKLYKKLQLIMSLERARDFREADSPYFPSTRLTNLSPTAN